jgi:hypothetical protein
MKNNFPTLEEFLLYIRANKLNITNPESLYAGYSDGGWVDTRGNKIVNWKLKLRTLHNFAKPKEKSLVELYGNS